MTRSGERRVGRDVGVDLARGVAVLLMIETHSCDGWATAQAKATWAYHTSRLFSNIPAALFLLLAGVGLAMAFQAGAARGADPGALRGRLLRRGLEVVGYGYLVSLAYALIEGPATLPRNLPALLRADILHCIGLSLCLCTLLVVGRRAVLLRAVAVTAVGLLLCLAAPRLLPLAPAGALPAPLAVPLALLVDVPPYTRFPLFPLCGFCALGVALGQRLVAVQPRPAPALLLGVLFSGLAAAFTWATSATVAALGGTLSRAHPAVVWNVLNGASRAAAVLFLCLALAQVLPERPLWPLLRLGRGSLRAYAFHIPFCYGRLALALGLAHGLQMPAVAGATLALMGVTLLAVLGKVPGRAKAQVKAPAARR
jgi:uncharacterized membrane protein